jgi:hypothetical protein
MRSKKSLVLSLMALNLSLIALNIEAAPNMPQSNYNNNQSNYNQAPEARIIKRDEIDNTDVYAIPLDSSEVEDEEEIDRLYKKDEFHLNR